MFNVFIKDTGNDTKHTPRKLTDNTRLGGVVDTVRGRVAIQRDGDKMKEWLNRNLIKVKNKCKDLNLTWKNPKTNTS